MAQRRRNIRPFAFIFNTKGINQKDGVFFIQPDSADIENLHVTKGGQWGNVNKGNEHFSALIETGSRIDSVGLYQNDAGNTYLLAASNGLIKHINTSTGAIVATVTSNNTAGNLVDFKTYKGQVYITEESMVPVKWDGTTTTSLSVFPKTVAPDVYNKPKMLEVYQGSMVYAGFDGFPSHIAISDADDPDSITTVTSNDGDGLITGVNDGDGYAITALQRFYNAASNDEALVIWKERGVYLLTGSSPNPSGDFYNIIQISSEYGCLNKNCAVRVGNDIIFLDRNNIYSLTTALQNGTIQPRIIGGDRVQETLATLNVSQASKAWVVHQPAEREVWFGIPTGSSTEVNRILVYRYSSDGTAEPAWSVRTGMNTTCAVVANETLYTGTNGGYLEEWGSSSQYNGTGMAWRIRYPFYGFGDVVTNKRILEAKAWIKCKEDTTITVKNRWRHSDTFNIKTTQTQTATIADQEQYGTAIFGTASYADQSGALKVVPFEVRGYGSQIQIDVSGLTNETGVEFLGITGLYETGSPNRSYR